MMEMMLTAAKKAIIPGAKGQPDVGFNFSTMKSTGKEPITISNAYRTELVGEKVTPEYTGALAAGSDAFPIVPTSGFGVETGDFTFEWRFYGQGTGSGTGRFFTGSVFGQVAFLAGSYGGKLGITNPGTSYLVFPITRAQVLGAWHHIALTRKNGLLRCFLDGNEVGVAEGTSPVFTLGGVAHPRSWVTNGVFGINDTTYPYGGMLAEFAFYKEAKYTENFTPTFPLAA